jgi:hypothetical protein
VDTAARRLLGMSMIGAPLLLVAGSALHPERTTDEAAQLAVIASDSGRWYAAHLLFVGSLVLSVSAVLGLMRLASSRPGLALAGTALSIAGAVAVAPIMGTELAAWQLAEGDPAAGAAALERMNESVGIAVLLVAGLGFPLGYALLGYALRATRAASPWEALGVAVAPSVFFAFGGASTGATLWIATTAAALALLAAQGSLGLAMLRGTAEPEARGPAEPAAAR